jgi:hypothetical protein
VDDTGLQLFSNSGNGRNGLLNDVRRAGSKLEEGRREAGIEKRRGNRDTAGSPVFASKSSVRGRRGTKKNDEPDELGKGNEGCLLRNIGGIGAVGLNRNDGVLEDASNTNGEDDPVRGGKKVN